MALYTLPDSAGIQVLESDPRYPVAANGKWNQGDLLALYTSGASQGYVDKYAVSKGMQIVGVAYSAYDNTGFSNDPNVLIPVGVRPWQFPYGSSGDAVTQANVGGLAYGKDERTVSPDSSGGTRSVVGVITGFDPLTNSAKVELRQAENVMLGLNAIPVASTAIERPTRWLHKTFSAPGAGQKDVTLFAANTLPSKLRVVDCFCQLSTPGAGGVTGTLRDTAAGGGAALSSAMDLSATGTARNDDTASRVAAPASTTGIFLSLSDGTAVVGEVWVLVAAES